MRKLVQVALVAILGVILGGTVAAQDVRVRQVTEIAMPAPVDSNSPAFWRDGRLFWYGSHGGPWLSEGADQFGPWTKHDVNLASQDAWPHWMESVWSESNGVLWGWYHGEPIGLVPNSTLTAPKIGAVVSFDGGINLTDLGVILESGDPLDPSAKNGYFAGGHGDFSVILNRERTYFYFLFDNYGGPAETQGVCVARMAYEDRLNPQGKVWKYYNGTWQEPGRGGRVTPIFPVQKSWKAADPDALWGPSVHWNTALNCFVMLLNHAAGSPGWAQEGVFISFSTDLSRPESWSEPRKILDKSEFPAWYFFYPQVMGLEPGGTDRLAGATARLYVGGISKWEIDFIATPTLPMGVELSAASTAVNAGETAVLSVTATGLAPFTYQWFKDGVAIPEATAATYEIPATAANNAGAYTVIVSNALGASVSNSVSLAVTVPIPVPPPTHIPRQTAFLSNLSVRSLLAPEHAELSVGFVLKGTGPKPLVLRAVGPSLAFFGVPDGMADPHLEIFDAASAKTAENDNWLQPDAEAFAAAGAFALPAGSLDAGLVIDAPPGPGTALVTGIGGGTVLVEIYDPAASASAKIVNLSARARVGTGNQVLIGGFNVSGTGTKRLLIRAVGPTLESFGVSNALADPVLEVYDGGATKIAENDNWDANMEPTFTSAGAWSLPSGSRDAAVVVTLAAGNSYSVVVRSAGETAGEALLEIYELP